MSDAAELPVPKPPRVERLNPLPLVLGAAILGGTLIVSALVISHRSAKGPASSTNTEPPAETSVPGFLSNPPAPEPPPLTEEQVRAALEARIGEPDFASDPSGFSTSEEYADVPASQAPASPPVDPSREMFGRALRAPVLVAVPNPQPVHAAGAAPAPRSLLDELGIPRDPQGPGVPEPPGIGSMLAALRPTLGLAESPAGATQPQPRPQAAAGHPTPADNLHTQEEGSAVAVRFSPPFDLSRGLRAGALIPAQLITAVDSTIPGDVLAQVERDVYSEDQRNLLIPRGTRLLGRADSQTAVGQNRLLVAWTRLLLPDGRSLEFPGLPSHGTTGEAGLPGRVKTHAARAFGNAILLSLVAAGLQLSQPQDSTAFGPSLSPQQITAAAIGQELAQVATEILRRDLRRAPTLRLAAGSRFLVFLNADLAFQPAPEPSRSLYPED